MPIDKMFSDAILSTFRNLYQECKDKKMEGSAFDSMGHVLKRMEDLADELNDFAEYNAKLTTEGLMNSFSQHYTELLMEASKANYQTEDAYSDENLLATTLKAYEDSVERLKGAGTGELAIPAIEQAIHLGKSGISYPEFLTKMIELGIENAMEGQVAFRAGIVQQIEFADKMFNLLEKKMYEEELETYDKLASKSPFNLPDSFELSLKIIEIEWKYQPDINKWYAIIKLWCKLYELLFDWLDSYCSFAPYDGRWAAPGASRAQTMKNIKRTQDCNPGFFKERERIFFENFGLKWNDIFEHPTFLNEKKAGRIVYSDERFQLILNTYQYCKPFEKPPKELINQDEIMYKEKRILNPNPFKIKE